MKRECMIKTVCSILGRDPVPLMQIWAGFNRIKKKWYFDIVVFETREVPNLEFSKIKTTGINTFYFIFKFESEPYLTNHYYTKKNTISKMILLR